MNKIVAFAFIITIIPAVIRAQQTCSPDNQCWSPCFDNPTFAAGQEKEFATLFKVIQGVRGAQKTYNTRETTFLFDASANNANIRTLQRNLASILALTTPVGTSCNPLFALQYTGNFIFTLFFNILIGGGWQCRNTCDSANILQTFGYTSQTTPPGSGDFVGLGCALGNFLNQLPLQCSTNNKRLLVAFENSVVSPVLLPQCFAPNYDAGVILKLSGETPTPLPRYATGMGSNADVLELDVDVYGSNSALASASSSLLQCIRNCCGCPASGGRKKREVDELEEGLEEQFDRLSIYDERRDQVAYYINATTGACPTCRQVYTIGKTTASKIPQLIRENAAKEPVRFNPDLATIVFPK